MIMKRVSKKSGYIHIIIISHNRKPIFVDNIEMLRESFKYTAEHYDFEISAICILPTHIHLILDLKDVKDCSKIITCIKHNFYKDYFELLKSQAEEYLNKHEIDVFQKRHYEYNIKGEDELNNHIKYIHYNPVKHELVKNVKDWEYSSFHKFVNEGKYLEDWGKGSDIASIKDLSFE